MSGSIKLECKHMMQKVHKILENSGGEIEIV